MQLAAAVRRRGLEAGDALRVATWLRDAGAAVEPPLSLAAAAEAYRARDPALAAELAASAEQDGDVGAATLARGQALAALGRHEDAEEVLARLEQAPPAPPQAAEYLFARLNVLLWGLREVERAERLVERAAGWWPDADWRRFTAALRMMVLSASGAVGEASGIADELATEPVDPRIAGLLATSGAIAWLHAGRTKTALAGTSGALPDPPADERLGDRELAGLVSWSLVRLEAGREWDEVEVRVSRIERASVRRGDRIAAGPAAGLLGYLALGRGAPRSAIRLLREAAGHLELHDPRSLSVLIEAHRAQAAALLGDLEQAQLAEAAARARLGTRAAAWHERPRLAIASAWTRAAGGEVGQAAEILLDHAADMDEWPLLRGIVLQEALSIGAPPARLLAGLGAAAALCDSPRIALAARHAEALVAEDPAALVEVSAGLEALGAHLLAAEAAAQAAVIFETEAIPAAATRARAGRDRLLASCEGASTPALRMAGVSASATLTRREHEVAELAAAGRSNAEIAALLVLSVRTVESHLYRAMAKLGTSRRGELAAALASESGAQGSAQELF
jgi:DNA-binding CsgD family transcriptional regulator